MTRCREVRTTLPRLRVNPLQFDERHARNIRRFARTHLPESWLKDPESTRIDVAFSKAGYGSSGVGGPDGFQMQNNKEM